MKILIENLVIQNKFLVVKKYLIIFQNYFVNKQMKLGTTINWEIR